jgi:hypothetical protein
MAGSATLKGEKFEVNKNQQNDEILLILRVQHKTLSDCRNAATCRVNLEFFIVIFVSLFYDC